MQRVPVWKIVVIACVLLMSLYILMPTFQFYSYTPYVRNSGVTPEMEEVTQKIQDGGLSDEERKTLQNRQLLLSENFRDLKEKSIRLGLDLQGGVHLVIMVDRNALEEQLRAEGKTVKEIDYAKETVLDSAAAVIEERVNQYGVSETALVKQPPDRLVLEMPGVSDVDDVERLVKLEAVLSFHLLPPQNELMRLIGDIDAAIEEDLPSLFAGADPYRAAVIVKDPDQVNIIKGILEREVVQSLIPREWRLAWGVVEEENAYYNFPHRYLFLIEDKPKLGGRNLASAWMDVDPMSNKPIVLLTFDSEGKNIFARETAKHVGEYLAIVMGDTVYTAPSIDERISGGSARISGINDFTEARQISVVLRAGAMPAPLEIAESRVVGPSLGQDSIQKGLYAGILGGIVVLIFMVVYYALAGAIADFAMIMSLFLIMAGMAMFKATLTLPGIAGIVLTIGMAVDANVLIFERLREEMKGKRAKTAQIVLDKGYGRAFMTIFDANITTLITALVLFQFGTGPIKGFAVTLSLGILVSMFTAIFVTRVIYDYLVAGGMTDLKVGSFHFFANAKYNFLANAKACLTTTVSIGVIGVLFFCLNWHSLRGIDFAGGTEMWVKFNDPVSVDTIRSTLESGGYEDSMIQEILGEDNQMMIRVPPDENQEVIPPAELREKLGELLNEYPFEEISSDLVGAKVGGELLLKGLYCLIFASIGILMYITARFQFRFAVAAVAALFHDVFFTLAVLAFTGTEFNLPIIAALLTVVGYSLNDTIVVFDRIRENYSSALLHFADIVNYSINQTLSRTINTSLTTFFVVATLFFFGGAVIHDFAKTLMIGIVIGTYSSIFIASPLLLMLGKESKLTKAITKAATQKA